MATISRNLIEILIQARDEASKELKKAGAEVSAFEKRVAVASAAMSVVGATMVATVSAIAIAGGRYADALDDLSARTLVSRDTLAALGVQLVKGGGQFEDAEVSVRTFSRAVVDAVSGNKEAIAQFDRLGISVNDLVGPGGAIRGFEELLPGVANGFAGLRDEAVKLDSAVALFGRSGTALVPILSDGSAGLDSAREEASRLNAVLSGPLQDAAGRLGDRMEVLGLSTKGLANTLAGVLDPTLGATVTSLANATVALSGFIERHPELTRNVLTVTATLAGMAAVIPVIHAVRAALAAMQLQMLASGVASALFTKQLGPLFVMGRNAAGQFSGLRATTLGMAAGFGLTTLAASAMAIAIGTLVTAGARHDEKMRESSEAERGFRETLDQGTASIREQIAALNALRTAAADAAAVKAGSQALGFERTQIVTGAREQALRDFDRENEKLRRDLEGRAAAERLGIEIPVDLLVNVTPPNVEELAAGLRSAYTQVVGQAGARVGPTIEAAKFTVPAPEVDFAPIDPRDFAAQIAKQREVLDAAREKLTEARAALSRTTDPVARVQVEANFEQAQASVATLSQRLFDLERQSQAATRELARGAGEVRQKLLDLDQAAGRVTLDESISAARVSVRGLAVDTDRARAAFDAAIPGTLAYATAQERMKDALDAEGQARARLLANEAEAENRRRRAIEGARAMEAATRDLSVAERDLATVQKAGTADAAVAEIERRNLERLRQERASAIAGADTSVGPVPAERFEQAASASRAYADALLQARQSTESLKTESEGAAIAVNALGGAFSGLLHAIVSGTTDFGSVMKNVIVGIIEDMVKLQLQAAATEKSIKSMKAASTVGGIAGLGLGPLGSLLSFLPGLQGGGEVVSGMHGVDSVAVRVGRNESVFDHSITGELKEFLRAQGSGSAASRQFSAGPQIGSLHVNINAGLGAASASDATRINRTLVEGTEDFIRTGIAMPTLA